MHDTKKEVHVYDYADFAVPMLERMFQRRTSAYESVGYKIIQPASAYPGWPSDVVLREVFTPLNGTRRGLEPLCIS